MVLSFSLFLFLSSPLCYKVHLGVLLYRKTRKLCGGFNRALRAVKKNGTIFVRTILDKMHIIIR